MNQRISLAITNFNRTDLLLKSFANVLNDERIGEIVIVDDCSEEKNYLLAIKLIRDYCGGNINHKIKIFRNPENKGMLPNKAEAISRATNEYCIILDSDNVLGTDYLKALSKQEWSPNTILCPDFAKPQFNYHAYREKTIRRGNFKKHYNTQHMYGNMFECLLNTCNYFVHKETYLKVWEDNPEIKGTDTLWFAYLWLKSGKSFYVVPNMEYAHSVHDGSEWLKNADYNLRKGKEIIKMILDLK